MKGKIKSQYAGLLLIGIMFFSTIGYAIVNSVYNPEARPTPKPSQLSIQRHMTRLLTDQEKYSLLKNGVSLMEFLHSPDCANCSSYSKPLLDLSTKFNDVVFVEATSDKTIIQITGKSTAEISNVTEKAFLDAYCSVSFSHPTECITKNF